MLKLTVTIERTKPKPCVRTDQRRHLQLPSAAKLFALAYGAIAATSAITGDQSLLVDFTKSMAIAAARLVGIELGG
jgi:hypothetical protein